MAWLQTPPGPPPTCGIQGKFLNLPALGFPVSKARIRRVLPSQGDCDRRTNDLGGQGGRS